MILEIRMYSEMQTKLAALAFTCCRSKQRRICHHLCKRNFHLLACSQSRDRHRPSERDVASSDRDEAQYVTSIDVIEQENYDSDLNDRLNGSEKKSGIQVVTEPFLTDVVKPLVKFRRRPRKDDVMPNLRENPVDKREIPKQYEITANERRYTTRSEEIFEEVKTMGLSKDSFRLAIEMYKERSKVHRRGQTEFIYTCLGKLQEFNVHKELSIYKEIMTIFPEDKLKSSNPFKAALMHKTKEQQCAIDVLETMESNGVIADDNMGYIVGRRFGIDSYVMRKYERSMFWMPKFRHANPYPVPLQLPNDALELAKMALKRMAVDINTKIDVWQTTEMEESPADDTFVASAMSPLQQEILASHPEDQPLVVEGGFIVWLRDQPQTYYILKAERTEKELLEEDEAKNVPQDAFDPESIAAMFEEEEATEFEKWAKKRSKSWSLHRQPEGTILAMCITGSCSKNSLMSWTRYLSLQNPHLVKIPILFSLRNPAGDVDLVDFSDIYKNSTTV